MKRLLISNRYVNLLCYLIIHPFTRARGGGRIAPSVERLFSISIKLLTNSFPTYVFELFIQAGASNIYLIREIFENRLSVVLL